MKKSILYNSKIIYRISDNLFLIYRHLDFFIYDGKKATKVGQIKSFRLKFLSYFRLLTRLFRLEPKCTEQVSENIYILCFLRKVWLLDVKNKTIQAIQESRQGFSDPINFCNDGNSVYWGDYGINPAYCNVNIYKIDSTLNVQTVYSFPKNSIKHIHNIIFDQKEDCYWILTGDNEKDAGIYRMTSDWSQITPIKNGEQKYRSVIAFPIPKGLIYASDAVEHDNSLYILQQTSNGYQEHQLTSINGSCIYGIELKDYYIFSTTVEPKQGPRLRMLLSEKLGNGIKSKDVHILCVNKHTLEIKKIASHEKDFWSMILFQYGAATFAKGNISNKLWYYPVACKKVDGKNILIQLENDNKSN